MASPGLRDVHIDAALTDYSSAYFQEPSSFVWNKVAPLIPVAQKSGKYYKYNIADTARTDARKRAPGTQAARRDYSLSTDTYNCDVWSIAMAISEQVLANADGVLDPEQDAVRVLMDDLMIRMEQDFASTFFASSVWGTDLNVNWADDASDPIGQLLTAANTIRGNTGRMPNTLVMGAATWFNALANHPDILSRIPNNMARIATPSFLGSLAGIENVYVAGSIRNTAQENLSASFSDNLGASALLCYVAPNPGPRTATAAATFSWAGLLGGNQGIRVKRFEIPQDDAFPLVELDAAFDFKVVGADLGYFFTTTTT